MDMSWVVLRIFHGTDYNAKLGIVQTLNVIRKMLRAVRSEGFTMNAEDTDEIRMGNNWN
jgi:hypothetical protein